MATSKTVVLITGGSSGIGLACAQHLAAKGFTVYGTSRNPNRYADRDWAFNMLPMNVDDDGSVQSAVQSLLDKEGQIDVVINNAGGGITGAIEETSVEEARQTIETNFFGVHRVCRAVLPIMRKQKSGKIIQISSIAAQFGLPFRGFYSASKAALEGYSEALRNEVLPFGIHVTLVEPGSIKTPINENRTIAAEAQRDQSVYRQVFDRVHDIIHKDVAGGLEPIEVAKQVERIIETPKPKVRYLVSAGIQKLAVVLYHILPTRFFLGTILRGNYKLD